MTKETKKMIPVFHVVATLYATDIRPPCLKWRMGIFQMRKCHVNYGWKYFQYCQPDTIET